MSKKQTIVTFKADSDLFDKIKDMPNRSKFIRDAVFRELNAICPLCDGKGVLEPAQKKHWDTFSISHPLTRCAHCDSMFFSCSHS